MILGVIIPTFQEEENIKTTVSQISSFLKMNNIDYEIIIVDDNSSDSTARIISNMIKKNSNIRFYLNNKKRGFGNSVVMGVEKSQADFLTIMMADSSDSLDDLLEYYNLMINDTNLDCVLGDRWIKGSVKNYPFFKKLLNRLGNNFISLVFNIKYYDFTNSFKIYRKSSLLKIYPILSNHFSITVELPLKMITRGFKYKIINNSWENREHGVSKMQLINSIKTYTIIIVYCFIDKYFWNKRYDTKG